MVLFCFTLVFMYDISSIFIANFLYYIYLFKELIKKGDIIIKNKPALWFYMAFVIWATLSTLIFGIEYSNMSVRTAIQYLFTLQYFVLILNLSIEKEKLELWIYRFTLLLSMAIIVFYLYFWMTSPSIVTNDMWGAKYFPGWPNSTPIPLLMGFWLSFRKQSRIITKAVIFMALFLTTSRIALLGALIISGYFLLKKTQKNKLQAMLILLPICVILGLVLGSILIFNPFIITALTVSWDRIEIFRTTMAYLYLRPIWGFGGNTLDQLSQIYGNFSSVKDWGHTHNWLLEMLLRYGIGGTVLFTGFIVSIYSKIVNKDKKFMFLLLFSAAFFQTYMREFVFLFYLMYLSMDDNKTLNNIEN